MVNLEPRLVAGSRSNAPAALRIAAIARQRRAVDQLRSQRPKRADDQLAC